MNHGYVFSVGILVLIILTATHWLDRFMAGPNKKRYRAKVILFFSVLLVTQGIYVTFKSNFAVNLSSILIPSLICFFYLWRIPQGQMWQMAAVIIFLSVFYSVSYQVLLMDPVLMIIPPVYLYPVFFTLFTLLITSELPRLWLLIGSGMIGGELIHKAFLLEDAGFVHVGDPLFRDKLFLAFILATVVTIILDYLSKLGKVVKRVVLVKGKLLP